MKIEVESKFEIGNTVGVKGTSTRFLIAEIKTNTCTAGTQVLYEGVISSSDYVTIKPKYRAEKVMTLNEVLLEKIDSK